MTEVIISLSTQMQQRLDFEHPLMNEVGENIYKLDDEQNQEVLTRFIESREDDDAFILTMSYSWLVKDLVSRFRAHWPQIIHMTDDLVSVGLEAIADYLHRNNPKYPIPESQVKFFNQLQAFIHNRMRDYINYNRGICAASTRQNNYLQEDEQPLEYHFAGQLNDEITGNEDNNTFIVDLLDSIEVLNDTDAEELKSRVMDFLEDEHGITADQLTRKELRALDQLIDNLGA